MHRALLIGMLCCATAMAGTTGKRANTAGNNASGQSGHSNYTMSGVMYAKAINCGGRHTLFLKNDGTVWAMGYNNHGQIGNGTKGSTNVTTPTQVFSSAIAIAAGNFCSFALKSDGTVWAWGFNDYGQLGDGTSGTDRLVPTQVLNLTNITAISAGQCLAAALKSDGTVWSWGYRGGGATPQQTALTNITAIALYRYHALALKSDGTVWSWGYNQYGQLGNDTKTDATYDAPVQVTGLANVVKVAAGVYTSYAIKSDGTLWAWGNNDYGQLGDGTQIEKTIPVQIMTNVSLIAGGDSFAIATKTDGSFWGWGIDRHRWGSPRVETMFLTPTREVNNEYPDGILAISAGAYHIGTITNNHAPTGTDITKNIDRDQSVLIDLAIFNHDDDRDVMNYTIVTPPLNGTYDLGTRTYTPNTGFIGTDAFTFRANDGFADGSIATATIHVNGPPTANPQSLVMNEDESIAVTLTGTDPDRDSLSFTVTGGPSMGTLSGTVPNLIYTPLANLNGTETINFTVFDGKTTSAPAAITITVQPVNDKPLAQHVNTGGNEDTTITDAMMAFDADGDPLTYIVTVQPNHGTLTTNGVQFSYTPDPNFNGMDQFTFVVSDGQLQSDPNTVSIEVVPVNDAPQIESGLTVIPKPAEPNQDVALEATYVDADGDVVTASIDFGDGVTRVMSRGLDTSWTHRYSVPGIYHARLTLRDSHGAESSYQTDVVVGHGPTPRFTTSDVVAFVGVPFGFDAFYSTDPDNDIDHFTWDFGDGSPMGSGMAIAKIYTAVGTYDVTLTVTDRTGISNTLTRSIVVLPASEYGTFNSEIVYSMRWRPNQTGKDKFKMMAIVNVGDYQVAEGTTVALEILGNKFTGTLDAKLRDRSDRNVKWSVKTGSRRQSYGEVILKVRINRATFGPGLKAMGITETVDQQIPVRLEIGPRIFELSIDSSFILSRTGRNGRCKNR